MSYLRYRRYARSAAFAEAADSPVLYLRAVITAYDHAVYGSFAVAAESAEAGVAQLIRAPAVAARAAVAARQCDIAAIDAYLIAAPQDPSLPI